MRGVSSAGVRSSFALNLAVAFLSAVGAARAHADYQVQTQAVAFPSSFYEAISSYNVAPHVGSYFYTDPDPNANYDCTATGTVDATGLATASFNHAGASSNIHLWQNYGIPIGAAAQTADSAANLATGVLSASGWGSMAGQ